MTPIDHSAPTLDKCAAAIAGVRARYTVVRVSDGWSVQVFDKDGYATEHLHDTNAACHAWIDEQAARACIGALLPVSEGVVGAIMDAQGTPGHFSDPCSVEFTAAITAVLGEKA